MTVLASCMAPAPAGSLSQCEGVSQSRAGPPGRTGVRGGDGSYLGFRRGDSKNWSDLGYVLKAKLTRCKSS